MNDFDKLIDMFNLIINKNIKFSVPRVGQVLKVDDDEISGRILVSIPVFGWTTEDLGQWCYPKDKKSIITPKKDDWVIVEWINGRKNNDDFAIYTGIATFMKDMLPENYDDKATTQVLFEDNNGDCYIFYDEESKQFEFTIKDFFSLVVDTQNKQYTIDDGSNLITADNNAGTYKIESGSGNVIEMGATSVKINENLEVLQ